MASICLHPITLSSFSYIFSEIYGAVLNLCEIFSSSVHFLASGLQYMYVPTIRFRTLSAPMKSRAPRSKWPQIVANGLKSFTDLTGDSQVFGPHRLFRNSPNYCCRSCSIFPESKPLKYFAQSSSRGRKKQLCSGSESVIVTIKHNKQKYNENSLS